MKQRLLSLLILLFSATHNFAQDKTGGNKAEEREVVRAHKVMLIPYEPKMYMGEVDRQIHNETSLSPAQIREQFREGLNQQLYKAFKKIDYNVIDLLEDSAKYHKELIKVYEFLRYDYLKVPDQEKFQPPVQDKKPKAVEKGQLAVETNSDKRFMNARMINAKIVPVLYKKYNSDLFLFINQLDIKASGVPDPTQFFQAAQNRVIAVHYTVYSHDGRVVNSGLAEEEFDPRLNNPTRIIDKHFSKVATSIASRVEKQLATVKN